MPSPRPRSDPRGPAVEAALMGIRVAVVLAVLYVLAREGRL
jgi:hypothetical protein